MPVGENGPKQQDRQDAGKQHPSPECRSSVGILEHDGRGADASQQGGSKPVPHGVQPGDVGEGPKPHHPQAGPGEEHADNRPSQAGAQRRNGSKSRRRSDDEAGEIEKRFADQPGCRDRVEPRSFEASPLRESHGNVHKRQQEETLRSEQPQPANGSRRPDRSPSCWAILTDHADRE